MADSSVPVTAGTGTSIDTRTEATDGHHRQVVVLGDPSVTAGVAPVDATAGVKVNLGADNDVTVSGTVTVDGSGVTQPVSAASLPLPSGAATEAKQPALGTAGTASADVLTIQGIASMTAVKVDNSAVTQPVSGTVSVTGVATLSEQQNQTTLLGNIDEDTASISISMGQVEETIYTDGTGTVTKGLAILGQDGTNPQAIKTDAAGELQVDVVGSLPAGTNAIGKLAANTGVDIGDVDVTSLPALVAGTAAIGKLLPPDIDVTTHTNYAKKYYTNSGAVTDGIVWSPAAGKRWHVVSMYVQTSAAATVTLEDDLGAGDSAVWKAELAANGGMTINFSEKYPLASGEDAADLIVTTSAGNIYITITGYEV